MREIGGVHVPRETWERLATLEQLVRSWTRRINLVSPASANDIWTRHIADSAQLWPLAPEDAKSWTDLGSGGGFPGLVIAAIVAAARPRMQVDLIESDARKAAFLREARRQLDLPARIHHARIESSGLPPADVVSARALAPLSRLLELSAPHRHSGTVLLFPKGRRAVSELTDAARHWHSRTEEIQSRTDPAAVIFRMTEVRAAE